ncbi:MAG: GNAT family N-acetyltransferase [Dehalococcoidia bacterium]
MTRVILPFSSAHLDAAAELLAKRHETQLLREPRLPRRFTSAAETKLLLEALLPRSEGVVAVEDDRVVGYLLSSPDSGWGGRARLVPMEGHAVGHSDAVEVYRELYAAASPAWNDAGFFQHAINLPAGDEAASAAFVSLGFGQMLAFGLRDLAPLEGVSKTVRIERAGEAHLEDVRRLMVGLGQYNSQSPLYRPFVPQTDTEWARGPAVLKQMVEENCAYWLAYDGDRAVGVMIFTPPDPTELMVSPEDAVYLWIAYVQPDARISGAGKALVDNGLAWARSRGLGHCTVGWFTTNITGARFWTGRGYAPVMHRLERRIDERIAWAKAAG